MLKNRQINYHCMKKYPEKDTDMSKLVLLGGGGHCKSVIDSVKFDTEYEEIVITDNASQIGTMIHGIRVVGNDEALQTLCNEGYDKAFISIASIKDTSLRRSIYEKAFSAGLSFPNIFDPTAVVSESVIIGEGIFVGKNAVINSGCKIDDFAIINTGAIVEHGCKIGTFSHVSVGSVICGECTIGKDTFIGANSTVIQGVRIGDNSVIGAGSIVLADVPENMLVTGIWEGDREKLGRK